MTAVLPSGDVHTWPWDGAFVPTRSKLSRVIFGASLMNLV